MWFAAAALAQSPAADAIAQEHLRVQALPVAGAPLVTEWYTQSGSLHLRLRNLGSRDWSVDWTRSFTADEAGSHAALVPATAEPSTPVPAGGAAFAVLLAVDGQDPPRPAIRPRDVGHTIEADLALVGPDDGVSWLRQPLVVRLDDPAAVAAEQERAEARDRLVQRATKSNRVVRYAWGAGVAGLGLMIAAVATDPLSTGGTILGVGGIALTGGGFAVGLGGSLLGQSAERKAEQMESDDD